MNSEKKDLLKNTDPVSRQGKKKFIFSEDTFRTLIENSCEGIAILSTEGKPLYISSSIEKILGYTEDEFVQTDIFALTRAEDIASLRAVMKEVLENPGTTINGYTGQMLHKDGSWRWVEAIFTNMLSDSAINGIVNNFRDITEGKLTLDRLKHNELRLKQAQEIAHVGSWELNLATGYATWSDEYCKIYGVSTNNNVHSYESWLSFIHPEDREYVARISREGMASLKNYEFYHRLAFKDGTIKYIFNESRFEFDDSGKPISVYGAIHDVTSSKEAEEKLIGANRLYSFISNINQTIVHVNNEQTLFKDVCRIAVNIGQFKVAWIGLFDKTDEKINLVEEAGMLPADVQLFTNAYYDSDGPQSYVLKTGTSFVGNDSRIDLKLDNWKQYASTRDYGSFIVLPIRKSGNVIGTFNLYASERDAFNASEVGFLEEAAGDISFALDVFEKESLKLQAENKRKYSELRLKQAQEIAHFGSWELDFSTGIALWSEEALRIYGLPPDDVVQSHEAWRSHIHPDDLEYVMQKTQEAQSTLSNSAFYHRIIRKDGAVRHIYSQAHFEFNKEGKPIGLYGVAHDVTEMKEAQGLLAQSEANLRLIIDLLPQSVFVKDFNGKYLFVNKSFAALYGLMPEELIHKSTMERITVPEEGLHFLEQDREVIRTGKKKIFTEEEFTNPNGEKKTFYTIKVPFTPVTSEKAVLGISSDITEQKKNEVERERMMTDILQRNENLQQFSYIISHNLRAPVASMMGLAQLLNDGSLNHDEIAMFPGHLLASIKQIDEVIRDLNKILQVEGGISETKEAVDLSELVDNICTSLNDMIQKEDVKIITDFSEAKEFVTLKSYLYSIFYNLITNSIKYHQPDLPPLIDIKSKKYDGKLIITIKDNGMGFDLLKKGNQVFGLYKRFHYHVEGKGVGLFMVKTQVETLGGKISVNSEINVGTEFTIVFEL